MEEETKEGRWHQKIPDPAMGCHQAGLSIEHAGFTATGAADGAGAAPVGRAAGHSAFCSRMEQTGAQGKSQMVQGVSNFTQSAPGFRLIQAPPPPPAGLVENSLLPHQPSVPPALLVPGLPVSSHRAPSPQHHCWVSECFPNGSQVAPLRGL